MARCTLWTGIAVLVAAASAAQAQSKIVPPPAKDFMLQAGQSDQYEIQAGRTAEVQATDPRVREYARQMVDDHTRTSQALKEAAAASRLPPPPEGVGSDLSRLLNTLQGLTGPEFDRTYMKQQVLAHHQALAVEGDYARGGDDANLRRTAQQASPIIQHHLQMAEQLQASLGGS